VQPDRRDAPCGAGGPARDRTRGPHRPRMRLMAEAAVPLVFSEPHWGRVGILIWVLRKREQERHRRCACQRRSFRAVVLGKGVTFLLANRAIVPGVSPILPSPRRSVPRREGVPGAAPGPGRRGPGYECGHPAGESRLRSRPPSGGGRGPAVASEGSTCQFFGFVWILFGSCRKHTLFALRDPFASGLVKPSGTSMHIWGRMGQGGIEDRGDSRPEPQSPPLRRCAPAGG